jgi:hypothetical protein
MSVLYRERGSRTADTTVAMAQYWANDQHTVAEIGQRIALETILELRPPLVEYLFVERIGLIEIAERKLARPLASLG